MYKSMWTKLPPNGMTAFKIKRSRVRIPALINLKTYRIHISVRTRYKKSCPPYFQLWISLCGRSVAGVTSEHNINIFFTQKQSFTFQRCFIWCEKKKCYVTRVFIFAIKLDK